MICSSTNQKKCWDAQMTDSFIFMFQLPYCFLAHSVTLKSNFAVPNTTDFFM